MRNKLTLVLVCSALVLPVADLAVAAEEAASPDCSALFGERVREMVIYLSERGWIGIEFDGEPPVLTRVVTEGPADQAGLEVGDVWLGVSGYEFAGKEEREAWKKMKQMIRPGAELTMVVSREGRRLELPLTPVAVPHPVMAQWIGGHLLDKYASDLIPKEEE